MSPKPPPRAAKKAPPQKKAIEPPKAAAPPAPESASPEPPPLKTSAEMPFLPVTQMPTNPDAVLNNLLAREMKHPSGPPEPPSQTLALMQTLVTGLSSGDIASIRTELTRRGTHQVEKAQVIDTVVNEDNFERTSDWLEIRHNSEKVIKKASRRGDMTTSEAVVLWRMSQDALSECFSRLEKTKPVDSVSVVEKIDIKAQQIEHSIQEKWQGTSPQGREIIRKKLHAFKKRLASAEAPEAKPTAKS